jgi:hypothetical protein
VYVVFIAGPFRATTTWRIEEHVRQAERMALQVWQAGFAAICPHTNSRFFQGEAPDSIWLVGYREILRRCDAVLLIPGWVSSEGAVAEMQEARRLKLPICRSVRELSEALNSKKKPRTRKPR